MLAHLLLLTLTLTWPTGTLAFAIRNRRAGAVGAAGGRALASQSVLLRMVVEIGPTDDDVDPPLPGQMKISEIKSELDVRNVSHGDCFDRESLESRLVDARSSGRADPGIVDEFNRRNLEANIKGERFEVSDDAIGEAVGGDGTLPGGMPPAMLKELMGNEELVAMLRSPKMQEVMKSVMSSGPEELKRLMKEDPEAYEIVQKLNRIMGSMDQS